MLEANLVISTRYYGFRFYGYEKRYYGFQYYSVHPFTAETFLKCIPLQVIT